MKVTEGERLTTAVSVKVEDDEEAEIDSEISAEEIPQEQSAE